MALLKMKQRQITWKSKMKRIFAEITENSWKNKTKQNPDSKR